MCLDESNKGVHIGCDALTTTISKTLYHFLHGRYSDSTILDLSLRVTGPSQKEPNAVRQDSVIETGQHTHRTVHSLPYLSHCAVMTPRRSDPFVSTVPASEAQARLLIARPLPATDNVAVHDSRHRDLSQNLTAQYVWSQWSTAQVSGSHEHQ